MSHISVKKPFAFANRVFNKTERKWTVTERELFAPYHFVLYFKYFLYGQSFELVSDHKPLVWLRTLKNSSPKLARWLMHLEAFNFIVKYKEGHKNCNADALSRLPALQDPKVEANAMELFEMKSGISLEEVREAQFNNSTVSHVMALLDNEEMDWPRIATFRPVYENRSDLFI